MDKSYGSPDVEQIYTHALQLFRQMEEPPRAGLLLMGMGSYFLMRGRRQEVQESAARLMELGRRWRDPRVLLQGYWLMAKDSLQQGDSTRALEYFSQAREFQERAEPAARACPRAFTEKLWIDTHVGSLVFLATAHSVRGHPGLAWQCTQEALERIRTLAHSATTAYGLGHLAVASQLRREVQCTLEWAREGSFLASGIWFQPLRTGTAAIPGGGGASDGGGDGRIRLQG